MSQPRESFTHYDLAEPVRSGRMTTMKLTLRGLAKGTGKAAAIYLAVELLAGAILLLLTLFHFLGKGHAH